MVRSLLNALVVSALLLSRLDSPVSDRADALSKEVLRLGNDPRGAAALIRLHSLIDDLDALNILAELSGSSNRPEVDLNQGAAKGELERDELPPLVPSKNKRNNPGNRESGLVSEGDGGRRRGGAQVLAMAGFA